MSYADNPYRSHSFEIAAYAEPNERTAFIRKTYLHLAGAVFAFAGLEAVLLNVPGLSERFMSLLAASRYSWLVVVGGFVLVSYVADNWARSSTSPGMQYLGLGLYVVAEAFIFLPLLYIAANFYDPQVIPTAGAATMVVFTGLTGIVFLTGADFSFLRTALWLGGLVAFGCVAAAAIFPQFALGIVFCFAMVGLASGYILYDTSNVLHHYRIGQHVAASLALFASVALLFWYILRIVMQFSRR
ncbi:MAG TPA: Bax inhibitor-1 family protein [Pirellulales bacterium]|nr:Bax inhibitor-1 family protein [Pirellulales bacterium]